MFHLHDGVAQVPLLAEQDVGGAGHEAAHRHVGQQVVLLQGHVGQTQVTLATQRSKVTLIQPAQRVILKSRRREVIYLLIFIFYFEGGGKVSMSRLTVEIRV